MLISFPHTPRRRMSIKTGAVCYKPTTNLSQKEWTTLWRHNGYW